eukprot:2053800-Amphidinium_carterae.1
MLRLEALTCVKKYNVLDRENFSAKSIHAKSKVPRTLQTKVPRTLKKSKAPTTLQSKVPGTLKK